MKNDDKHIESLLNLFMQGDLLIINPVDRRVQPQIAASLF